MSGIKNRIKNELHDGGVKMSGSLGKTPGYARYSGYDTEEQEDEYLSLLGPSGVMAIQCRNRKFVMRSLIGNGRRADD
jgi:hypothetical protein